MILDLTRSHCTSYEIPGFWALLVATSETDEHLFFPLGIYYIWSSCLQMKIFWLLQPKSNVQLSPPQDLDTRPKFQLLGQWVQEWYTNIRMIADMQKYDEFVEQRKTNSEKSKTKIREEFKREIQRCLTKDSEEEPKCLQNGREKVLEAWITNIAFLPESLHPYWNWRWRRRRYWISAFFFIAACLWFLLPNFANQFFFLPSGMVTSLSHVLLEKLLSSPLDPKFPLQSVARNSPLAQFLGHPVLPRFQSLLSLTSTNKAKLRQGLRRNPWTSIHLRSYPTCNICCCCCWRFSGGIRFSVAYCCSLHGPCTTILEAWEELFWLSHRETLGALCNQLYDSSFWIA